MPFMPLSDNVLPEVQWWSSCNARVRIKDTWHMFHVQWEDEAHGAEVNYEDYTHGKLTEIMFRQIVEDRILELAQFWLENSLDSARCSITSGTRGLHLKTHDLHGILVIDND